MNMFGSSKKRRTSYGAIIDVGSGSVGVGIVASDHTEALPYILYSHREYMRRGNKKGDKDERLRHLREALFTASLQLTSAGLTQLKEYDSRARISNILVTCSSPWAHTVTRDVLYEHDRPFKVHDTLIEELVAEAEEQAAAELNELDIVRELGLTVVERATVGVRANGYEIGDPVGRRVKSLALSHITGLVPTDIVDAVHEVRDKVLVDTRVSTHTFMLVFYCVIRDIYPKTNDYAIIDVTGESTEIGIIEDGILKHTAHAGFGSNSLIRSILESYNGTEDDLITRLNVLSEDTSHESAPELDAFMKPFESAFSETLERIHADTALPTTLVVTALPELARVFEQRVPKVLQAVTNHECSILELHQNILNEMALHENSDPFITVASRFFHKLHGCGEIENK